MDLRRILNINDSSKPSNRSSQSSSRSGHSRTASRSTSSKTTSRPPTSVKIEPTWPLSPIQSPTASDPSSPQPWMASLTEPAPNYGRMSTAIRPRISTSTTSPSTAAKRRISTHSPVSRSSSSSSSSPAPPTPVSVSSVNHGFSSIPSSTSHHHKREPSSTEVLPSFHQIAAQPAYTISMTPIYTTQPAIHSHRTLPPLPISRTLSTSQPHRPLAPQHHQAPPPTVSATTHNTHSHQRLCSASPNCDYITPKRRIVSQFFGRNKKETRLIPRHCWVYYCRQHYQRSRYRLCAGRFAELQMGLVRATVSAIEKLGIVVSWEVKLRKRALERIASANSPKSASSSKKSSGHKSTSSRSSNSSSETEVARERVLLPYCGAGKSFKHIYDVLDLVRDVCRRDGGSALEFEILPVFTTEWVRGEEERRRIARAEGEVDSESEDDER